MENHNIFLSQSGSNSDKTDISGKITYTSVIESIPENKVEKPIKDWTKYYTVEYRWRFMKDGERRIVEISKKKKGEPRLYFNRFGEWTTLDKDIDEVCNKFVIQQYFVYTE
ncbi:MAG: hypothetical protein Barrevirus3_9 [Barrevirus sp.]|uniref:Uncharacterized protein n=1 Tax=Barrevirus sp. TaxID=2487763 RepID=A0A3G4ZTY7_9VIRU|nr:MAG: hypothetical protein Barrevirus3_9 [Barrevirus sp.]